MSEIYYTTMDGTSTGRASHYFRSDKSAKEVMEKQNTRASNLGIKARYTVAVRDDDGIESKDIRE